MTSTLFYNDPRSFFKGWNEFWPFDHGLSFVQKLNAAARLTLYIAVVLYLVKRDVRFLVGGAVAIGCIGIYASNSNPMGTTAIKPTVGYDPTSPLQHDLVNKSVIMKQPVGDRSESEQWMDKQRATSACRKSSLQNPFANHLVGDQMSMETPCAYDAQKDVVEKHFKHNLMQDSDDIYEKNNSQRQFYSMPTGSIPDTRAFAMFLAGGSVQPTCKEASTNCKTNTGY
jgi:hypothetical protein